MPKKITGRANSYAASHVVILGFLLGLLATFATQIGIVSADDGVWSSEPNRDADCNQVTYSISGFKVTSVKDDTNYGKRIIYGELDGKELRFSGEASCSLYDYVESEVWVTVDNVTDRKDFRGGAFSVAVAIPPNAESASFGISVYYIYVDCLSQGDRPDPSQPKCPMGTSLKGVSTAVSSGSTGATGSTGPSSGASSSAWIVVVGGVAAVVAAGTAAVATAAAMALKRGAKSGKSSSKDKKKKQKDEPQTRYILQLSAEQVEVLPGKPAGLGVTAWKVKGTAPPQLAPEANLQITVQPPTAGLQVMPSAGQGRLQAAISLSEKSSASAASLVIVASAAGTRVTALVAVRIMTPAYVLEVS